MEVVLGNGEVLRTGEGSVRPENAINWHVSKYSFGPVLDGLFAQSNFGVVTRAAVWLLPRPPTIESFHFVFESDDDLGSVLDLIRPLKMSNYVPTLFRVCNDLYAVGTEESSPEYTQTGGRVALSATAHSALRAKHKLGRGKCRGPFTGRAGHPCSDDRARKGAFRPHQKARGSCPMMKRLVSRRSK